MARRSRSTMKALSLLGLLAGIAVAPVSYGCADRDSPEKGALKAQSLRVLSVKNESTSASTAQSKSSNGLANLPPPSAITAKAFASGRSDPFSPSNPYDQLPPKPLDRVIRAVPPREILEEIKDLKVEGIMDSNGIKVIFVKFKGFGGDVKVGEVGGASTPFLPSGWQFSRLDKSKGEITLRKNKLEAIIYL